MRYTPWIVSEHVPDFSTLENLVKSPRFAGKKGQDLAITLWQIMVDDDLGIFHYCPAQEPFWGKDAFDPLQIFNVYGFAICHIHAHVLAMLFEAAGFKARIANIRGHEGTEVFYDGRWHYFDADIQMFHRLHPPQQDIVASREDTYRDPTLVSHQENPSFPYHMPDRLPEKFAELYKVEPSYPDTMRERLHSMDFRLRPGETMGRYFHHRGRWVIFEPYPEFFRHWRNETGPEGPTERFWPRRQWANGCFTYAPKLSSEFRDVELGADEVAGLALRPDGLICEAGAGHAIFAFESPYIYCGVPDPWRRVPPLEGATLAAVFDLPAGASARIEGALECSGEWQTLWSSGGASGETKCNIDFTELADAQYRLRLRFVLEGAGAALRSFETRLWFMVSPHSLPALRNAGDNRMSFHSGDRYGLRTRPLLVQHLANERAAVAEAHSTENLRHEPESWECFLPVDPARPWQVVYELSAPSGGKMAWASVFSLIEGRDPNAEYDGTPTKIEIADSPGGPWRTLCEREILEHPLKWHFACFGEGRFSGKSAVGYVRFSAKAGAKGFRIMGHYAPADATAPVATAPGQTAPAPLEVQHTWYEVHPDVGRRLHSHTEAIAGESHEYIVRCGHEPHDEQIILRVPSVKKG